eukprot:1151838-Pelagomonas_calceolata.AAC.7
MAEDVRGAVVAKCIFGPKEVTCPRICSGICAHILDLTTNLRKGLQGMKRDADAPDWRRQQKLAAYEALFASFCV